MASPEPIAEVAAFQLPDLMDRDKSLAYDEYTQIKEKYNKLVANVQSDSKDFESLLKLSEIYIYEARVTGEHPHYYNAALNTLDHLLLSESELTRDQHFLALFYKSTVQLSQHNFGDALLTAEKAVDLNDVNAGIYGVLVDAHVEIGNYNKAVEMCDKMMSIRPDLRSYSRTSYLREIHGDLDGSKRAMVRAVKAGAPYSEYKCWALTTLGKMYESEGKLDSAQICYEVAVEERADYPFGTAGMARVQAKKGNVDQAMKLYQKAMTVLPEIGFNIEVAQLKKQAGKEEDFNKMLAEIETMFKEDMESGHNMSLEFANFLYTLKGDYDGALKYALEEHKNRPENIDVNKSLAFIYYGKGDMENAKRHAEKAMATDKRDADMICLHGLIEQDIAKIRESFDLNPYQSHPFAEQGMSIAKS